MRMSSVFLPSTSRRKRWNGKARIASPIKLLMAFRGLNLSQKSSAIACGAIRSGNSKAKMLIPGNNSEGTRLPSAIASVAPVNARLSQ